MTDDNEAILELIQDRMAKGRTEYGHGIRSADDTRQYGTVDDTWAEMALEEALDMTLYLAAELMRIKSRLSEEYALAPPTPPKKKIGRLQRFFGWFR